MNNFSLLNTFIMIIECCLLYYIILVCSYAVEHYYIEYLSLYWDKSPDDVFLEEIISILTQYDKKIINNENCGREVLTQKLCNLYRNHIEFRIVLYKYGMKNRFIKYFKIEIDEDN